MALKTLLAAGAAALGVGATMPANAQELAGKTAHEFTFQAITGEDLALSQYAGKTLLVVNTASFCGYTGQYDDLQAIYEAHQDQGLVVLGVPSGSFNQESATDAEVKDFCEVNFNITFPMTSIVEVNGEASHPFFDWVRVQSGDRKFPTWNFNKALIGADGSLIATYGSGGMTSRKTVQPKLKADIEAQLGLTS